MRLHIIKEETIHGPNAQVKEYIDGKPIETQVKLWDFFSYICNEIPGVRELLIGELKSHTITED